MKIHFKIKGLAPVLFDKWPEGDETAPKTDAGYRKQAENKVYRDSKDNLALPAAAINGAMKKAAASLTGRKQKDTVQSMRAFVFINPKLLTILPERKTHDGITKMIVTRNSGSKSETRVPSYRPIVNEWEVEGEIDYEEFGEDFLKQCLELAGRKYGVLSFTPEYGRFSLESFEVLPESDITLKG